MYVSIYICVCERECVYTYMYLCIYICIYKYMYLLSTDLLMGAGKVKRALWFAVRLPPQIWGSSYSQHIMPETAGQMDL